VWVGLWVEVRDNARKSTENKWFARMGLDTDLALYQFEFYGISRITGVDDAQIKDESLYFQQ
jgi:hypothetical protein